MKLEVEWAHPLPLLSGAREGLIYTVDLDRIERVPGVYIFARRWGSSFEALYVGQSGNLRSRVKTHLNSLRLMRHIETAKTGKRFVLLGQPVFKPGQQAARVLRVLERALIRHFLAEGHDLVNKQGVKIRRHEINSAGPLPRRFLPSPMYLERSRRE